jgi:hypothetical protein
MSDKYRLITIFCHTVKQSIEPQGVGMLSVRLPPALEVQLAQYCESAHLSKSAVVQQALESHLKAQITAKRRLQVSIDPIDALIGSAPRAVTTDEWMRQTRGEDWGQP